MTRQEPGAMREYDSARYLRQEGLVNEAAPVWPAGQSAESGAGRTENRKYTIDDYYAFRDEKRRELIDGRIFVMEAPSLRHQTILGELYILFRECIRLHSQNCRVFLSPCDVQLNRDKYTMVQPDLLIICDEEKLTPRVCYGAPDLAVEIMSPSSRSRDAVLKLNKYMQAGVREYWLVDPEARSLVVYRSAQEESRDADREGKRSERAESRDADREGKPSAGVESRDADREGKPSAGVEGTFRQYSFDDTVPVGISGGKCSIDFSIVAKALEGIPE